MRDASSPAVPVARPNRLSGAVVGAVIGALGRFLVALCFLYYVLNQGGPFFRQQQGATFSELLAGTERWPMFLVSSLFGLIVGGIGGSTCRPLLGSAIGGGLSGLFCVGMFVLPATVMIGLSGGGVTDYSADMTPIAVGLLAMILVGAAAGGIGATIGKHS